MLWMPEMFTLLGEPNAGTGRVSQREPAEVARQSPVWSTARQLSSGLGLQCTPPTVRGEGRFEGALSKKAAPCPRQQGRTEGTMLSGVSQTEKDRHHTLSLTWGTRKSRAHVTESRRMVTGLGAGWGRLFRGTHLETSPGALRHSRDIVQQQRIVKFKVADRLHLNCSHRKQAAAM